MIAGSADDEYAPAVTAGPAGSARFGIAHQRFVPEAPYGSTPAVLRTFSK